MIPDGSLIAPVLWSVSPLIYLDSGEIENDIIQENAYCLICGYCARHLLGVPSDDSRAIVEGWFEDELEARVLATTIDTGIEDAIGFDDSRTPPSDELRQFMADHVASIHPGHWIEMHYAIHQ